MDTLNYIQNKVGFTWDKDSKLPIELPNVGRNILTEWLHELDFKIGVEIGVAAGEYSEIICLNNPQMAVYGIDSWAPYKGYRDYTKDSTFKKLYETTLKRMKTYRNYQIIKDFSEYALRYFADNSVDFVYIDGNHSEPYVSQDINGWYKKVKTGGILAGHDYARMRGKTESATLDTNWQVKDAIQRFTKENNINPWFVLGAEAKILGTIRDDIRSWMIVK